MVRFRNKSTLYCAIQTPKRFLIETKITCMVRFGTT